MQNTFIFYLINRRISEALNHNFIMGRDRIAMCSGLIGDAKEPCYKPGKYYCNQCETQAKILNQPTVRNGDSILFK